MDRLTWRGPYTTVSWILVRLLSYYSYSTTVQTSNLWQAIHLLNPLTNYIDFFTLPLGPALDTAKALAVVLILLYKQSTERKPLHYDGDEQPTSRNQKPEHIHEDEVNPEVKGFRAVIDLPGRELVKHGRGKIQQVPVELARGNQSLDGMPVGRVPDDEQCSQERQRAPGDLPQVSTATRGRASHRTTVLVSIQSTRGSEII